MCTNNANKLRLGAEPHQGITLGQVSGIGMCLLGPGMLIPALLVPVCNYTVVVNVSTQYVQALNSTYLACSFGLTPHIVTESFLQNNDYCVLLLLPGLIICPAEELLSFWERGTVMPRHKREPITAITLAVILGLGAAGAGTGIVSLITSNQQYNQLSIAVDKDIRELQQGLKYLKEIVAFLAEVVLQNRRGLYFVFLQE